MANAAEQAIQSSIEHNEIVTIDYDADDAATLAAECDDSVHSCSFGETEYWANDPESETAMLWRVHMRDEVVS